MVRKRNTADKRRKNRARKRLARIWPTAVAIGLVGIVAVVVAFAVVGGGAGQSQPALTPVSESNGGSHAAVSRTGGPAIYFPTTSVDFGQVPLDTPAAYAFEFTNMGNDTLRIEDLSQMKVLEGC